MKKSLNLTVTMKTLIQISSLKHMIPPENDNLYTPKCASTHKNHNKKQGKEERNEELMTLTF